MFPGTEEWKDAASLDLLRLACENGTQEDFDAIEANIQELLREAIPDQASWC